MWILLLLLGSVATTPTDEFRAFVNEGELSVNEYNTLKQIVPSGYSTQSVHAKTLTLSTTDPMANDYLSKFIRLHERGVTQKGLTFNVYDDDMRNAAIFLFRIFRLTRITDRSTYELLIDWAKDYINNDMYDYARRLTALYTTYISDDKFLPPFISKPNYFINGETIMKALYVKHNLGKIDDAIKLHYQIFNIDKKNIAINSNYSGWNIPIDECDKEIKYFTEDIALNSYYYGVHLLHPFWMSNEELSEINPRHAEHYYFVHQQLSARYLLEKEHFGPQSKYSQKSCESDYYPYLYYENGLPFPTRSSVLGDNVRDMLAYLKTIDIAIKECISRGLVIMENSKFIHVNEDNYIDLMTKLIRANFDGVKAAKVIRSIFGYGNNGYPVDKYNPSPSILHHPQTTLRDPVYWYLIQKTLDYYSEYENSTTPYNITAYETDGINITQATISKLATYFDYDLINLEKALNADSHSNINRVTPNIFARQRRLKHIPFTLDFNVKSMGQKNVVIRLFLGPRCLMHECWSLYTKFFQLDCYKYTLVDGLNLISWSPDTSSKYLSIQNEDNNDVYNHIEENYDIFKFPGNLVLPKGTVDGLNLTLSVIITEYDSSNGDISDTNAYRKISYENDNKPLGFPFHRPANIYNKRATNYKFYNVTVYHLKEVVDHTGRFSEYLY